LKVPVPRWPWESALKKDALAVVVGRDLLHGGDGFIDQLDDVGVKFCVVRPGRHAGGARRRYALPGANDAVSISYRASIRICRIVAVQDVLRLIVVEDEQGVVVFVLLDHPIEVAVLVAAVEYAADHLERHPQTPFRRMRQSLRPRHRDRGTG
jgi:hypothetical protein